MAPIRSPIAFSEAVSKKARPDKAAWVHFYEDDYRFTRFWINPERYLDRLAANGGVISPDHSLYRVLDYPRAVGVAVHVFKPDSRRRSKSRDAA
ncbi:DUF4417 domain-containing protein [Gordonia sp. (in: high G+C Gram-positive bacteria)]|uniref:DUF4417 domain-containing protein n=1 Tax=Gordonia sp. (in: high G+C Gram-positive bacteria) TaxID=84139 RepID=UPI00262F13D5|nr:DUF4417 domain-containing protein [Gordonia sp. (in: high G+C Gram-positive bacteria)]HMS74638.1 DUF4417 domain-containing protein [Gordonia sp. (in: high G+C Gram-positive bacteria)]